MYLYFLFLDADLVQLDEILPDENKYFFSAWMNSLNLWCNGPFSQQPSPKKVWDETTAALFQFGDGYVISSHILQSIYSFIHAGIKINPWLAKGILEC